MEKIRGNTHKLVLQGSQLVIKGKFFGNWFGKWLGKKQPLDLSSQRLFWEILLDSSTMDTFKIEWDRVLNRLV